MFFVWSLVLFLEVYGFVGVNLVLLLGFYGRFTPQHPHGGGSE